MTVWIARLETAGNFDGRLAVRASYYDVADVAFATPLASEQFVFDASSTRAQMRDTIIARGQEIRAAKAAVDNFLSVFPIGTTLNVP